MNHVTSCLRPANLIRTCISAEGGYSSHLILPLPFVSHHSVCLQAARLTLHIKTSIPSERRGFPETIYRHRSQPQKPFVPQLQERQIFLKCAMPPFWKRRIKPPPTDLVGGPYHAIPDNKSIRYMVLEAGKDDEPLVCRPPYLAPSQDALFRGYFICLGL
jgi:hypothetical protein